MTEDIYMTAWTFSMITCAIVYIQSKIMFKKSGDRSFAGYVMRHFKLFGTEMLIITLLTIGIMLG